MNDTDALSRFERFCGNSPFWNTSLTMDGPYPAFTPCFKEVGLAWIPTFIFLTLSVPYAIYLRRLPNLPSRDRFLVSTKLFCCVALLALTIAILLYKACDDDQDKIPDALYMSEALKAMAFVLACYLVSAERRKGMRSSAVLWLFWLMMLVAAIIPFYSNLKEDVKDTDEPGFILFYIYFAFILLSFVLSSFADNGHGVYKPANQRSTPEVHASFPSILTFWWITSLVIKGYREILKKNDVYGLNPTDTSAMLVPRFTQHWEKAKSIVQRTTPPDIIVQKSSPSLNAKPVTHSLQGSVNEATPCLQFHQSKSGYTHGTSSEKSSSGSSRPPVSLIHVLLKTYGLLLFSCLSLRTLFDLLPLLTPMITKALIDYVSKRDAYYKWRGYALAVSYMVVNMTASFGQNQSLFWLKRLGMRIKVTLTNAVYRKILCRSSCEDDTSLGQIINYVSVDCLTIEDVMTYVYMMMSLPVQLSVTLYLLYSELGNATFAGLGVLCFILPINVVVGYFFNNIFNEWVEHKDSRMKLTSEILNGIKVLKFYAWEGSFEEKLLEVRKKEIWCLKRINLIETSIESLLISTPILVQVASFAVYVNISDEGYLSPSVAAVSLGLFNLLNYPFNIMPLLIPYTLEAFVAIRRISKFLNKPDLDAKATQRGNDPGYSINIHNGSFTWDKSQRMTTLKDINLKVKQGQLVAVVGTVGCGKSSLLSAMLGEMTKLSGQVLVNGSTAYVPQEAWIQNATLNDNILFGNEYKRQKYNRTVNACALQADLDILPGGDNTEIGEKGINISGGQKQRVSLARAVYSDQDIYLLDDPLSAVDSHVGKHIFKHVLSHDGLLKDKTRILVTHGIHWLPMVDSIIVMEHGLIKETGTYEELLSKDGVFSQLLKEHILQESDSEDEDPEAEAMKKIVLERVESITGSAKSFGSSAEIMTQFSKASSNTDEPRQGIPSPRKRTKSRLNSDSSHGETTFSRENSHDMSDSRSSSKGESCSKPKCVETRDPSWAAGKLIDEEKQGEGRVKLSIYLYYLQFIGIRVCIASLLILFAYMGISVFIPIWLSKWTDDSLLNNLSRSDEDEYNERTDMYLGVYGVAGVCQGMLMFALSTWLLSGSRAARIIHERLLANVLRSPMSFFDSTPMGRIVNRFSGDMDDVSYELPRRIFAVFLGFGAVTITIATISYGNPFFLIAMVPLSIVYICVQTAYIPTSRQLQRLESVSRSPIYVHITETVNGANSIRAYRVQDRFISEMEERMDANTEFCFPRIAATSWLSFCLQFLGNVVVFLTAIFIVVNKDIEPGIAGMSVAYAAQMTAILDRWINMIAEAETSAVAVERIKEYSLWSREADWVIPRHRPRTEWPEAGNLVFEHYKTRYRPGLNLVLNNINCNIKGGEKIGIVGRTGAGKSSITLSLFRIIEAAGGNIIIDGEDLSALGLHDLRSKLTILPQEPVLFSGSLRMNLDPFNKFNDNDLWNALGQSNLKDFVKGLPQGLDYECGESGNNLSVGQRQLVCLARTLLRRTKILVLDEATAAVDMKTDEFIQDTIRREFTDSTVLTIAHRLHTIMDYDRVMVLDKGSIIEFDTPTRLLEDEDGAFYSMAKSAGIVS